YVTSFSRCRPLACGNCTLQFFQLGKRLLDVGQGSFHGGGQRLLSFLCRGLAGPPPDAIRSQVAKGREVEVGKASARDVIGSRLADQLRGQMHENGGFHRSRLHFLPRRREDFSQGSARRGERLDPDGGDPRQLVV